MKDDPVVDQYAELEQDQTDHRIGDDDAEFPADRDRRVAGGGRGQHQRYRERAAGQRQPERKVVTLREFVPGVHAEQYAGPVAQRADGGDSHGQIQRHDAPNPDAQ